MHNVLCGYYCFLFLNERIGKKSSYEEIFNYFKPNDFEFNEHL